MTEITGHVVKANAEQLLPCPFCGGAAILCGDNEMNPRHWVMCKECHACPGGDVPELDDAVAAWNRRRLHEARAGVTEDMVNAADSVLSRRRPGIPDETIRLAIEAALYAAERGHKIKPHQNFIPRAALSTKEPTHG